MTDREQLLQAIAAQESLRGTVDDDIIDNTIALLQSQLAELDTLPEAEQQRKQVTILFADVVGSTSMSEHLDPEDVMSIMDGGLRLFAEAVREHGGEIGRFMGDGMLAFFGAPSAREDDPERAVRAGLAVLAAARNYEKQVKAQWGVKQFAARVGINTGLVVVGEMGLGRATDYTAMGDAVNLAARLESAAPAGGLLIGHDTYQHVRGLFETQALKPFSVKGKSEPVRAYVVHRAKALVFRRGRRGVEGIKTRMIGRDAELKRLQDAFYTVLEQKERQVVTIAGEAGVGKSRLLYEFDNWAEVQPDRFYLFKGRASLETQNLPFAIIRDLFFFRFQIRDSDNADSVREKLERGVGSALETEQTELNAHFIGQLLGIDLSDSPHLKDVLEDANQIYDRALVYMTEYFKALAARHPVLILLEDLHWADDSSLDLLNQLTLAFPDQPVLIIVTTRPTLFERRPHWGEGHSFHQRLDLRLLSSRDSGRLVKELLQKVAEVPAQLRKRVVSGAEGNPFYVEELIKILIEDGVIITAEEEWRVELERLAALRVPPTLTGILQARLDQLPTDERVILQQASVVGRRFWDAAVERVSLAATRDIGAEELPAEQVDAINNALSGLRQKEMIFRRETSALAGTKEYIFKHAVQREVTYESILKRVRRVYHTLVADWLIEHIAERADEFTGLIGNHLELAGDATRAVRYLTQAGEQAAARYANNEAAEYFGRALKLTPTADLEGRYALHLAREKVYYVQAERLPQSKDLKVLATLAQKIDDLQGTVQRQTEVALRQANYELHTSAYQTAAATSETAVELSQIMQQSGTQDAESQEATAYLYWGRALAYQGQHDAARDKLDRAQSKAAGLPHLEADILRSLGNLAKLQADYSGARRYLEQALDIVSQIGNKRDVAQTLYMLRTAVHAQGDFASGRRYLELSLDMAREIGDKQLEGYASFWMAVDAKTREEFSFARHYINQALDLSRHTGNKRNEAIALTFLAILVAFNGEHAVAVGYLEQSLLIFRQIGDRQGESGTVKLLGIVFWHQGDYAKSRDYCQRAIDISRQIEDHEGEANALEALGHAWLGLGNVDKAANAFRMVLDLSNEWNTEEFLIGTLAGLAIVHLVQGEPKLALKYVENILNLQAGNHEYIFDPSFIYLTCYQVLKANRDPRASAVLEEAYGKLQKRAAEMEDEERRRLLLENVTFNREILAEYSKYLESKP